MSFEKYIGEYILDNPLLEKDVLRAFKYFKNYTSKSIWEVYRNDIYQIDGNCFRQYLSESIKSDNGKNKILRTLDRFYQYWIIRMKCEDSNFSFINPFDYKFDKFKLLVKYSTYREVIPLDVINLMQHILIRNDFEFGRKFKDDYKDEKWSPSTTIFLYTILTIPLRGLQAQLLDSGLGDEFIYDFDNGTMIRNLNGEKKRKEGFIQMGHYSSLSNEMKEYLWITTNKSMNAGYEINWVDKELLAVIKYQIEFLSQFELGEKRNKKSLACEDGYHFLFRDVCVGDGFGTVSKAKIYKLWKRLCLEVQNELDVKLVKKGKCIFGLHNIRVSLISHWLDKGVNLKMVSQNITGHASEGMTLYYYRSDNLRDKLKSVENKIGMLENLKLIGVGKNESN